MNTWWGIEPGSTGSVDFQAADENAIELSCETFTMQPGDACIEILD